MDAKIRWGKGGKRRQNRRGTRILPRMQRAFPEDQCTSLHSPGGGVYVCVHVCVCVCCTSPPASLPQPSYSSQSMASLWLRRYGEGVGGGKPHYMRLGAHDPSLLPSGPGLPRRVSIPLDLQDKAVRGSGWSFPDFRRQSSIPQSREDELSLGPRPLGGAGQSCSSHPPRPPQQLWRPQDAWR